MLELIYYIILQFVGEGIPDQIVGSNWVTFGGREELKAPLANLAQVGDIGDGLIFYKVLQFIFYSKKTSLLGIEPGDKFDFGFA